MRVRFGIARDVTRIVHKCADVGGNGRDGRLVGQVVVITRGGNGSEVRGVLYLRIVVSGLVGCLGPSG